MAEMTNSALLEKILAHARTLCGATEAAMTAERFLASVIEAVSGEFELELPVQDRTALRQLLRDSLSDTDAAFAGAKAKLLSRISENRSMGYLDSLYMQQRVYKAKETAKKDGLEELTPAVLLRSIFSEPNDYLRGLMNGAAGAEAKRGESSGGGRQSDGSGAKRSDDTDSGDSKRGGDTDRGDAKRADPEPRRDPNEDPKVTVAHLTEKVKATHARLLESVFGQDNAVSVFTTGYFQAELLAMTDRSRSRPRATFLFAGPPGVGKTFLAEKAAEALELPFMRFDMSEYSDNEAPVEFCGADNVYKNAKEGNVTGFVAKHNRCVLLFDEIEKAHLNVIHLF
ncbi:MAG: AAA family ATPase, partial [Oscillospiraceae bacterium]|nr:AAA family ATPase [Oscillospiraceae bacterium]